MIHIRFSDISALSEVEYQKLYGLARPERQQKANRYLRKEDAQRCIVADGLLRYALTQATGSDQHPLACTPEGKPFLPGQERVHFNISHSGRWVTIAWTDRPVGIDVETIQWDDSKEQLSRRFFHPDEHTGLFAVSGSERAMRFFEIWTRKESYLKYLGTGLCRPLNSFSVLEPMDVTFHTQRLSDAMLSVCAQDTEFQIMPLPVEMLLCD